MLAIPAPGASHYIPSRLIAPLGPSITPSTAETQVFDAPCPPPEQQVVLQLLDLLLVGLHLLQQRLPLLLQLVLLLQDQLAQQLVLQAWGDALDNMVAQLYITRLECRGVRCHAPEGEGCNEVTWLGIDLGEWPRATVMRAAFRQSDG